MGSLAKNVARGRKLLAEAFRILRNEGFLALENHLCCTSCAANSLIDQVDQERKVGGFYWHEQDDDAFSETGHLHVGFAVSNLAALTALGEDVLQGQTPKDLARPENAQVLESVFSALKKKADELATSMAKRGLSVLIETGLDASWDGDCGRKILVRVHEEESL